MSTLRRCSAPAPETVEKSRPPYVYNRDGRSDTWQTYIAVDDEDYRIWEHNETRNQWFVSDDV